MGETGCSWSPRDAPVPSLWASFPTCLLARQSTLRVCRNLEQERVLITPTAIS